MATKGPELRARLKSKLLGLEDKDLREQIERELQRVFAALNGTQQVDQGLKELFSSLDSCNTTARKLRYRCVLQAAARACCVSAASSTQRLS